MPALAKPELALGRFSSVSFDPQSKRTVTIHSDSRSFPRDFCIRVWDNDSGGLLAVMAEQSGQTVYASFSPDSARILSAAWDGAARVWDSESGVCLLSLEQHEGGLTKAIFSLDGCYIATASRYRNVHLWRGEDGVRLATFAEHTRWVTDLAFSPDGRTLASGGVDGIVHIRDIKGSFSTDVS